MDESHGQRRVKSVFRLRKIDDAKSKIAPKDDRARFQAGLVELRAVRNLADYKDAKAKGVRFSIDGFRTRNKLGNQSMRTKHADLFEQMKEVLDFIQAKIVGVKRNADGRSGGLSAVSRETNLKNRIIELEELLDRREIDYLNLLDEVRHLRQD